MSNQESVLENETNKHFWDKNRSSNLGKTTRPSESQQQQQQQLRKLHQRKKTKTNAE